MLYDISYIFKPEPDKKTPPPPQLTASQVKFDLLNFAYNRYINYYFTPNKNLKKELGYLCDVSLFLSDEVTVNNYLDEYLKYIISKKPKYYKNYTVDEILNLLKTDSNYYPTVVEDGTVKWIIEPGNFVPLVNEINTRCDNKLSTNTINKHLKERNTQIMELRIRNEMRKGAFQPEIYYEPKIENTVPISLVVPGDDNTNNPVLDIGDINIDLETPAPAPTPALVNDENNTNFVPHKTNMLGRLKNWVLKRSSKKVQPYYAGNSRKTKSRKTKSKKSRKQRKRKSKSRI